MRTLSLNTARQFILHCQLLAPGRQQSGEAGVLKTIQHLGYVQIDTISVIERAHHHVLWTRVPDYQHRFLQAHEEQRTVFDYWAHAASYLPMEYYPFSLFQKSRVGKGGGFWRLSDPELSAHVLERIRKEGPLMSKDFKKAKDKPDLAWRIPAINAVIQQLFMKGDLMVAGRKGILKSFDLPERILPKNISTKMPTVEDFAEHIVRRDLRAHGLVKLSEFGHLLRFSRKEYKSVLEKMMEKDEVVEVIIKGVSDATYFAFNNLIIQRKRLGEIFNFQYTLECYVPAAKRQFGYFGLPLLYGHKFVGLLDAKVDRKTKILHIRKLEWHAKVSKTLLKAFEKKLKSFAAFCGCEEIEK